ncbi:MAG TPA: DUF58 domain-containing protein [Polyangiaceae bacterium]|nr:DUF58 domain-containing protein [Polyangiaceae bacterium]
MSIYPTRTAAHLAVAGLIVFALGIALREPLVVAWGGALLVGVAFARAVTLVSVMRIRAAGFEMLWVGAARRARVRVGGTLSLEAEVRNRDTLAARYDKLRVVASPALETTVEPLAGEVYATGSVKLKVRVRALRVGYHGIYGLALEVRGAPGLFEVPLTFANPFGIEVLPKALARPLVTPAGGRSSTLAMAGRSGRQRGDGTDLRELREHLPGDPFRWIAWKASARRGLLVVKEFEREERDVVMLVLDASVELWAGPMGGAPLDRAIDVAATLAAHHIGTGDLVGLRVVAARQLVRIEPDTGRAQTSRIVAALMEHTGVFDADRCGWDDSDLATQVTEHMRPLDPRALSDLRRGRLDKLVRRAGSLRGHAPFNRPMPQGRNPADARLRRYAACFGMHLPARLEPDRSRTAGVLAATLLELARHRKPPRVTVVHIVAPPPAPPFLETLARAVRKLKGRGVSVRWSTPPVATPLVVERPEPVGEDAPLVEEVLPDPALLPVVERAVVIRAAVANRRGEQALRKLGIKVVRSARPAVLLGAPAPDEERGEVA